MAWSGRPSRYINVDLAGERAFTAVSMTGMKLRAVFATIGLGTSQAALAASRAPPPIILPMPGVVAATCPLPEPRTGELKSYPVPKIGVYAAHGTASLLPVRVEVTRGEGPHGMDEVLFGARTTFVFPRATRLSEAPSPIENVGKSRRMMKVLWGGRTGKSAGGTTIYRIKVTAPAWEISGAKGGAACLYLHANTSAHRRMGTMSL